MSLVRPRNMIVLAAAVAAVAVPVMLLSAEPPPPAAAAAPPPAAPVKPDQPGALAYALAAPPFDPDRTPGAAPQAAAADAAAAAPPPAPLPKLVGIAGGRGRMVALVKTGSGETLMLRRGQSADGWQLVSVARGEAVFERAGERQSARLDFSNKVPVAPPASPAPAPPPEVPQPAAPAPKL